MDKNKIVLDWLKEFENFDKLYFNFGDVEHGAMAFIPTPTDRVIKTDILGNQTKLYKFAVTAFLTFDTIPNSSSNLVDYSQLQLLINWVSERNKNKIFPDFGKDCEVEKIESLQNVPQIAGQNENIAQYLMQFQITYIEKEN